MKDKIFGYTSQELTHSVDTVKLMTPGWVMATEDVFLTLKYLLNEVSELKSEVKTLKELNER